MNTTQSAGTQATDKQVSFALSLMARAGFDTRFMSARHSKLGATMRQRSGSVEGWLRSMARHEVSALIDSLKGLS